MFETGFSLEALRTCLAELQPVELKGMTLLRECRPLGRFLPTGLPREVIGEAVTEIVGYTQRCQRAVEQLSSLRAISLTTFAVVEYGL